MIDGHEKQAMARVTWSAAVYTVQLNELSAYRSGLSIQGGERETEMKTLYFEL